MKVLVTGALGFVGRALSDRYRSMGAEVVGVDLRPDPALGVVAGDVSQPGGWTDAFAGCDVVINTAAHVSNTGSNEEFFRLSVLSTRRVIEAAMAADVGRVVHLSSIRAFSDRVFPPEVPETYPVRTNGRPYVDTKIASEQVALQAHAAGEIPVTIVRPGDVYGPRSRPWTLMPVQDLKRGTLILPLRGRGVISPVYVDNLTEGIAQAAASDAAAGRVLTLTDGRGVEASRFFAYYSDALGCRPARTFSTPVAKVVAEGIRAWAWARRTITFVSAQNMEYLSRTETYSISLARELFAYDPRVSLDEGMERTIRWLTDEGMLG